MLFYNFQILDHYITNDFINNLKTEETAITELISLYGDKKKDLQTITDHLIEFAELIPKNQSKVFHKQVSSLKELFENLNAIHLLASKLKRDLKATIALYDNLENNKNEIKANLVEYNKHRDELSNQILIFEKSYTPIITNVIPLFIASKKAKKKNLLTSLSTAEQERNRVDIELEPYDSNILIVSEKDQKAYLPFFYSEVMALYKNSNHPYATLQDVVNDCYVLPLNRFQNSIMARFKEAFRLVRVKDHGSITKALDLALEVMFKYELNPIIIAACRNLEELDIYLDCLEENQLNDFKCFEIRFETSPKIASKNGKNAFLF